MIERAGDKRRTGVTLTEIMVVVVLGSLVAGAAYAILSANRRLFQTGMGRMTAQSLMETIRVNIRSDVRRMTEIVPQTDPRVFQGKVLEEDGPRLVTYTFSPESRLLVREEQALSAGAPPTTRDFGSRGLVREVRFLPVLAPCHGFELPERLDCLLVIEETDAPGQDGRSVQTFAGHLRPLSRQNSRGPLGTFVAEEFHEP